MHGSAQDGLGGDTFREAQLGMGGMGCLSLVWNMSAVNLVLPGWLPTKQSFHFCRGRLSNIQTFTELSESLKGILMHINH